MKHFLMRFSIIGCLLLLCAMPVFAASSYSNLYISISDALMNTKQNKDVEVQKALDQFATDWALIKTSENEEKANVDKAFEKSVNAKTKEDRIQALSELSNALRALEKKENPVDESAQRTEFSQKFAPIMKNFETALSTGGIEQIEEAYKDLNAKWNKYERPIREQSMAMYGQIETQMAFIRITLASDQPDLASVKEQYAQLKQSIDDFVAGKETAEVVEGEYSLATLIEFIDEATKQIAKQDYAAAANQIREFITVWPTVELEISTRNGSLYTKIESEMPIIVSNLMKTSVDAEKITKQLNQFKTEIELIQENTSYSYWDAALILLREGLEALLIIIALAAFLGKSGQQSMRKWIFIGAGVGVLLSAVVAIIMSMLLNAASVDANRELLEGFIGLIAAVMMIGVGIWLHNKSSVASWNRYISKQMNHAISKGSVFSMAAISFLSVFREGAETLVFYAGIAPKMEVSQFIVGIVIALVILAIVAIVLTKMSGKIPVHKFFAVATILIYVLAFKIIGVSLHTLQLLDKLSTTVFDGLPVISTVGFYPTMETLIGQVILLILIIITIFYKKMKK